MTEIGELLAPPRAHKGESTNCPFCPKEPPPDYTTWPGERNDSDALGIIMEAPAQLVPKQPGARPKDRKPDHQDESDPQPMSEWIFRGKKAEPYGPYSCEAHHLISGKQALAAAGHQFERWIVPQKGTIEKDTGYSVNNADNGIWAPSIPERYKDGKWGPMTFEKKYEIAKKPMEAGYPQFHKGHHAIRDPDDPDEIKHETYDGYLKGMLKVLDDRMRLWAQKCPLCDNGKKAKFQPSVRVHDVLDRLSAAARRKISPPPEQWDVFLSRYALTYHNDGRCAHGEREE